MNDHLETPRLVLRRWRTADRAPFAALNADPAVMEWMPGVLTRHESDALVDRIEAHFESHGFGLWAVERKDSGAFIGFAGLSVVPFDAHFTPAVEVGYRLAAGHWGQGFATEAAQKAVDTGFHVLGLDDIVSFTAADNVPSQRVMAKLGMTHDPADDFGHPLLPEGHRLRHHVLYRLRRGNWTDESQHAAGEVERHTNGRSRSSDV